LVGLTFEDLAGSLECLQLSEGAVEGAFVLAAVTGEAVELFGDGFIGEVWEFLGFHGFDAAEVPGGGGELFEDGVFERIGGLELVAVFGFELGEGFTFVFADLEASGEVVLVGVAADDGFALDGAVRWSVVRWPG
jgi:hypothetical protein